MDAAGQGSAQPGALSGHLHTLVRTLGRLARPEPWHWTGYSRGYEGGEVAYIITSPPVGY